MRVCILGWYGTETIGDRGILAGIFSFLHKSFGSGFTVSLGSLCPYFSERTLTEDSSFYKKSTGTDTAVRIFDSRKSQELESAVAHCDLLIVGGGPLMHINALFMIEYAFKLAKKKGKKAMLLGCGVGPLSRKRHQKATVSIAENCDKIILRDEASVETLRFLFKQFSQRYDESKVSSSLDPSVESLLNFSKLPPVVQGEEYVALNMRFFPQLYGSEQSASSIDSMLYEILQIVAERFLDKKIRLIPMGYFHLSHDDRDFLNTLKIKLEKNNVEVQNMILSLEQTMEVFQNASLNIGMRFHSVVFQTMLSGKNIVLDYTEPEKGKISGFLQDIGGDALYKDRYFNLQLLSGAQEVHAGLEKMDVSGKFSFNEEAVKQKLEIYTTTLRTFA